MGRYFVLRFFLFAGCLLVLWLVGLRSPIPLVLLAMIASSVIALVTFRSQRDHAAAGLKTRIDARAAKIEQHRVAEDDEDSEDDPNL